MQEQRKKLIAAFLEKPTTYTIDVLDNSMLPDNLKEKKELDFVVKPPTLQTLAMISSPLQDLPKELLKGKPTLHDAIPYIDTMIKVICIISHAKKTDYPQWYEPFFKANCTPKDIFLIFTEVALKMQSDFFLTSFQIASQTNPMMMHRKNYSTLTSS